MPRTASNAPHILVYRLDIIPTLPRMRRVSASCAGRCMMGSWDLADKAECVRPTSPARGSRGLGFKMVDALSADRDLVLMLPERQKEQVSRTWLALSHPL